MYIHTHLYAHDSAHILYIYGRLHVCTYIYIYMYTDRGGVLLCGMSVEVPV